MSPKDAAPDQSIGFAQASDGTRIAYAFSGGGVPIIKTANWLTHIEYDWRTPVWRHWVEFLSGEGRLLRYDERGNGLSDHDVEDVTFERWIDDLESLVAQTSLDRFSLVGISQGGAVALEYAARYPEKVDKIVLCGAYALGWARRDDIAEQERARALLKLIESGWGEDNPAYRTIFANLFAPDANNDDALAFAELQRMSTEPSNAARLVAASGDIDIRSSLPNIKAPTLVTHARQDARVPFEQGRYLAASIPGARFVPLDSRNHALLSTDPAWETFKYEFRQFLSTGTPRNQQSASIYAPFGALTERERDVVAQVAAGLDNAAVGDCLGISEKTVRNHLTRIFDKFGVNSRAELIVRVRNG